MPDPAEPRVEDGAGGLRWVPDPHRADTTDLRDADGRLRGWVAPVCGIWRGVAAKSTFTPSPYADHPDELTARAWVEAEVRRMGARRANEAGGGDRAAS